MRCDIGAALRAAGRRRDAQEMLEPAYARANDMGAVRIAERAAEELATVGVRPRREPATGLAALTPSERRVAELAAAGKTNREIAESLFVTQKIALPPAQLVVAEGPPVMLGAVSTVTTALPVRLIADGLPAASITRRSTARSP